MKMAYKRTEKQNPSRLMKSVDELIEALRPLGVDGSAELAAQELDPNSREAQEYLTNRLAQVSGQKAGEVASGDSFSWRTPTVEAQITSLTNDHGVDALHELHTGYASRLGDSVFCETYVAARLRSAADFHAMTGKRIGDAGRRADAGVQDRGLVDAAITRQRARKAALVGQRIADRENRDEVFAERQKAAAKKSSPVNGTPVADGDDPIMQALARRRPRA